MSKSYSKYWIRLTVDDLGSMHVRIRDIATGKEIIDDYIYSFEQMYETYKACKKALLEVPELKKLIERS